MDVAAAAEELLKLQLDGDELDGGGGGGDAAAAAADDEAAATTPTAALGQQQQQHRQHHHEKPVFHVAPASGWVNDPNGPFMHNGVYHLFYQHLPGACEWGWGLVWGHAYSRDLVTWERLPHAMAPSAASLDADGCFSGCATVDVDGTPVLLYTGVRLRTNADAPPLPPPECDLKLPFIESQLFATPADAGDPLLALWRKEAEPFIALPPPDMNLTGWRDPFVVERPCAANNHEWVVLMGSGIKDVGGTVIVYRAARLRDAATWRYDGLLCSGDGDTGLVWECPLLAELNPLPAGGVPLGSAAHDRLALAPLRRSMSSQQALSGGGGGDCDGAVSTVVGFKSPRSSADGADHHHRHHHRQRQPRCSPGGGPPRPLGLVHPGGPFGALAPRPPPGGVPPPPVDERFTHFYSISPDACTNPTIYWLGRYADGRFDLDAARGPLRLDLGDVLYAPNVMRDESGRLLLWGWLQERRTVGAYDYAGCMSVPRLLHLDHDRLHQAPAPELLALRRGEAWSCGRVRLGPDAPLAMPGAVGGAALDIEAVFVPGSATTVGVLLRSWNQSGEGGAAVLFSWSSGGAGSDGDGDNGAAAAAAGVDGAADGSAATGHLEVAFEALDTSTMQFSLTAPLARRVGGPVAAPRPGAPLALRLLLDGSLLEVFTGAGEVLTTRVHRGAPPPSAPGPGIEFVALDGEATLQRVAAYEMSAIWRAEAAAEAAAAAAGITAEERGEQQAAAAEQQQQALLAAKQGGELSPTAAAAVAAAAAAAAANDGAGGNEALAELEGLGLDDVGGGAAAAAAGAGAAATAAAAAAAADAPAQVQRGIALPAAVALAAKEARSRSGSFAGGGFDGLHDDGAAGVVVGGALPSPLAAKLRPQQQQLLLSPRTLALGALPNGELPPEEELTADLFGLL